MRYRFQGLYELDSLAVVNVRDTGPVKHGFKILMFPESHMYQTDTAKAKVKQQLYYKPIAVIKSFSLAIPSLFFYFINTRPADILLFDIKACISKSYLCNS